MTDTCAFSERDRDSWGTSCDQPAWTRVPLTDSRGWSSATVTMPLCPTHLFQWLRAGALPLRPQDEIALVRRALRDFTEAMDRFFALLEKESDAASLREAGAATDAAQRRYLGALDRARPLRVSSL